MREDPYRKVAGWYDRLFEPMNSSLRSIGLKMFPPKEGMTVLDVGCGTGIHLDRYQSAGCEVFGIDPSPSMLEIARHRLSDQAELYLGDASEMPYEDRSFDLVISMLVLHEMDPATRTSVIGEMKRVVKNDGRILLIDFHPGPVRPLKGWLPRIIIFLSEVAAGRKHFKNYRDFMAIKGLPTLIAKHQLVIVQRRVVSGGNMAIFLLSLD